MANPALKNGYISIANELVEKLAMVNIPGNEMRIIWTLWRKTWGWQDGERKKDWDWISYTQFAKLTGIKRRNCVDCVKALVSKRILVKKENSYKFNQNYDDWVVSKRTPSVQKHTRVVSKRIRKVVSKSRPTIDNKETNTKESTEQSSEAIVTVIDSFKEVNPAYKDWFKRTPQRQACQWLVSEFGLEKVLSMIAYLPKLNAMRYAPTTTSPYELKYNLAKIKAFMDKERSNITNKRGFII